VAAAAALRARSFALRGALAARVLICFSRLLFNLSLRLPIQISFQYFYQICDAVPGLTANKAFLVLLQPACNRYAWIVRAMQGKSKELISYVVVRIAYIVG
jgi:hypothetical protein